MKLTLTALAFALVSTTFAHAGVLEMKPGSSDPEAAEKCARLSSHARAKGVRTLVIGFEGLASFSGSATRAAYQYHAELVSGRKASKAGGFGMGGYVARGLMMPTITRAAPRFELLVFPHTATGTAHICAQQWMKVPGRKLVLVGHSFGGMSVMRVTNELAQRNIRVSTVISVDPRSVLPGGIQRVRGADRWENFYQYGGGLPGKSIREADVNERLSGGHTGMPYQPAVRASLLRAIAR